MVSKFEYRFTNCFITDFELKRIYDFYNRDVRLCLQQLFDALNIFFAQSWLAVHEDGFWFRWSHPCRCGNLCCYNKRHIAHSWQYVLLGSPVCQGQRKNNGGAIQLLYL